MNSSGLKTSYDTSSQKYIIQIKRYITPFKHGLQIDEIKVYIVELCIEDEKLHSSKLMLLYLD